MKMYVGIDPGKNGGICFLNPAGGIEHISPMPCEKTLSGLLSCSQIIAHVALEKSQCFSGQGILSTFNYGIGYGKIQGILIAHQVPFTLVPPRTWQKHMIMKTKIKQDPKKKALASANRIFKKESSFWLPSKRHRKPHDGMIDSALIAEYCRKRKTL